MVLSLRYFRDAGFRIAPLKVSDFKSAREIFTEEFPTTRICDFQYAWRNRNRGSPSTGVYTKEGDLVGFLLCDMGGYKFENSHIAFIIVHSQFQKYRLGSALLETFLEKECSARRNVTLTPLYTHVWYWYHKKGFYVAQYLNTIDGDVFTLMNFHHYPTRKHNQHLWFPSLLPVGNCSSRYVMR